MNLRSVSARRGSLRVLVSLVGLAVVCATVTPADARRGHRRVHRTHHAAPYKPPYAAIVVDVKTGKVLHAENPDALRHPASITKVMTLYLLFEQLDKGALRLDSRIRISAHAASQSPTKLGLDRGDTISVEDAIKAVVTRSANDIAVAIAEHIGGSEAAFAEMMTRKARSLGMSRTVYMNASGLPDTEQVTTARDLSVLARAIQERFPRYYPYFSIPSFSYAGMQIRNHNRLLGRVEGVDGIKTGFTRMSGFNLMTSAKSDGHHIVAIVLGGRSGGARDRIMASLVGENLPRAYAGARTAPMIAEAPVSDQPLRHLAALAARPVADGGTDDEEGDLDAPTSALPKAEARGSAPARRTIDVAGVRPVVASASGSLSTTTPSAFRWVSGPQGTARSGTGDDAPAQRLAYAGEPRALDIRGLQKPRAESGEARSSVAKTETRTDTRADKSDAKGGSKADTRIDTKAPPVSGWIIQLGATEDEAKAKALLESARSTAAMLNRASPFTEKIVKDGSTLWRARFSGFDPNSAQAACKTLKRNGFSCFATKI